ncbi:MAG TPA: carboxypeptidase-like regulatory domain-containing protein, partial [Niastella sp.]|nr:carboxypeptidase-like regulatory domain-containing protein [Niastella sp.]
MLLFFLAIVVQQETIAQSRKISGTIKDDKGTPLSGVSIEAVKSSGNGIGTATDAQGNFSLTIDASYKLLSITGIGYTTQDITIGSKTAFDITLQKNEAVNLSDVIVVAYGQQKKASVTAAISTISAKEVVQSPVANISNALAGRLPGLISVQSTGKPGA